MAKTTKRELSVLFPHETLLVSGTEVTLSPFTWKKFQRVTELISTYGTLISSEDTAMGIAQKILTGGDVNAFDDITEIISYAINKDVVWIEERSHAEVLGLFAEVIGANLSFFSQTGDLLAKKMGTKPSEAANQPTKVGSTPGIDSSAGDITPEI